MPSRPTHKKKSDNGKKPEEEVLEPIPSPSTLPSTDDALQDWSTAGEPEPVSKEVNQWSAAVTEMEEDAKWDGSNEPADIISQNPEEPTSSENWGTPQTMAAPEEEDTWEAGAAPNMTLSIYQHTGTFNKETFKFMLYGDTGTEKSRTASTFPNAIFADVDHGMSSVTEQVDVAWIDDNNNGFDQLKELYRFLAYDNHGYETVVLDTLNEMQRVIMRFTVEEYTHVRRSYGNLPGQSDYGKMLYEFMELTRAFISLPMKVVLLAQVNTQQFETDNVGPQLIGKNTARELARKMDLIGFIYKAEAEEGTVPEITFDSPIYTTKDRSNRLPVALPRPSYGKMSSYWK